VTPEEFAAKAKQMADAGYKIVCVFCAEGLKEDEICRCEDRAEYDILMKTAQEAGMNELFLKSIAAARDSKKKPEVLAVGGQPDKLDQAEGKLHEALAHFTDQQPEQAFRAIQAALRLVIQAKAER
jgi:hypothetical protein